MDTEEELPDGLVDSIYKLAELLAQLHLVGSGRSAGDEEMYEFLLGLLRDTSVGGLVKRNGMLVLADGEKVSFFMEIGSLPRFGE